MSALAYSKYIIAFFSFATALAVWPLEARAQNGAIWGASTNGLRLGLKIYSKDSFGNEQPPQCILYIQNVSTNGKSIYIHRAPPEIRYEMKLLDPLGKPLDLIPGKLSSVESSFRNGGTLKSNEIDQITYFFVTDIFKVQTNGLHTLIVAERFTTNSVPPRPTFPFSIFYEPLKPSAYFLLPPVTNTFNISTNGYAQVP